MIAVRDSNKESRDMTAMTCNKADELQILVM
jgi:hypothetical protein